MALTRSKASSIFTPQGNSLAVFIDVVDGVIKLKDVFGGVISLVDALSLSFDDLTVNKISFNTSYVHTALDEGEMAWNQVDGTLDVRMGRGGGNFANRSRVVLSTRSK